MKEQAIILGNKVHTYKILPSKIPGVNYLGDLRNLSKLQLFNLGFRPVYRKPLLENEKYIEPLEVSDYNENLKTFIYRIQQTPVLSEAELAELELKKTKSVYEKYKIDGWQTYQDFRANMVNKIEQEELTELQVFEIEDVLSVGFDKISNTGDWKTAQYKLSQVTLPSGSFIEPYLTQTLTTIEEYITNNYQF